MFMNPTRISRLSSQELLRLMDWIVVYSETLDDVVTEEVPRSRDSRAASPSALLSDGALSPVLDDRGGRTPKIPV